MSTTGQPLSDIRRTNLERLIGEAGSAAALARRAGTSDSYISQVRRRVREHGERRRIGGRLAARLESAMGKPQGWLDRVHSGPAAEAAPMEAGSAMRGKPTQGQGHPLLSWQQAAAGIAPADTAAVDGRSVFRCPVPCGPRTFVLRIEGASMEPRFGSGELIFVDPDGTAMPGRHVVVHQPDSDEATLRQLLEEGGRHYLRAHHPHWPEPVVEVGPDTRICGVVVFRGAPE